MCSVKEREPWPEQHRAHAILVASFTKPLSYFSNNYTVTIFFMLPKIGFLKDWFMMLSVYTVKWLLILSFVTRTSVLSGIYQSIENS